VRDLDQVRIPAGFRRQHFDMPWVPLFLIDCPLSSGDWHCSDVRAAAIVAVTLLTEYQSRNGESIDGGQRSAAAPGVTLCAKTRTLSALWA
jgi:hypothetical protein